MFMHHPDETSLGVGAAYARGWKGLRVSTPREVATVASRYACSPCLWANGHRKQDNFRVAEWIGLDFDANLCLADALPIFQPYMHIIGTTKSHGVSKDGEPARDRYRVFLKVWERITDPNDYAETVRPWIKDYGADPTCADAARFFWPCKEIVSLNISGKVIHRVDSTEAVARRNALNRQYTVHMDKFRADGSLRDAHDLPPHVENKLRYGVSNNRNNTVYGVAADLAFLGYPYEEIVGKIIDSAIPTSTSAEPLSELEIRGAVKRGMEKGLRKQSF